MQLRLMVVRYSPAPRPPPPGPHLLPALLPPPTPILQGFTTGEYLLPLIHTPGARPAMRPILQDFTTDEYLLPLIQTLGAAEWVEVFTPAAAGGRRGPAAAPSIPVGDLLRAFQEL